MTVVLLAAACRAPESAPRPRPAPEPPVHPAPSSDPPAPAPTPPQTLEVGSSPATSLGTTGFSANGRIQPHGAPTTYWFEHGPTTAYGATTPVRALGPRLAAHYTESWDGGLGGWRGGSGLDLVHDPAGFVRYSEPTGTDYNHTDGIGWLHLVQYAYPGRWAFYEPTTALGGADPDLRDARVEVTVRGVDWDDREWWLDPTIPPPFARGDELVFWAQADATEARDFSQMSNWAHTGSYLTDALYSGDWTRVDYRLRADTNDWSYAGQDRTQGRDVYVYHPLGEVLRHLDVDFFHLLLFVDDYVELYGAIDFDELHVTYRNHSLLFPSNGATLTTSPAGGTDPAALTDGWRHEAGHTWQSGPYPSGPLELVWELAAPVVIERVQVHNDPEWPSRDVEVLASSDGTTWTSITSGTLPDAGVEGPNFAYLLAGGLAAEASAVKVVVSTGWRDERWGLGEVELFGAGATMATDDDEYSVTEDVTGLGPGETVHWRLVAEGPDGVVAGPDQVYVVPTGEVPEVATLSATPIGGTRVRLAGRINTLGDSGTYAFELGPDEAYGHTSTPVYTGPEITPRTFSRIVDVTHPDLADLPSGSTAHWRIVLRTDDDVVHAGADATFVVP